MKTRKTILVGVLFSVVACLFGMVSCNSQPSEQSAQAALDKKGGMVVTMEVSMPEATENICAVLQTRLNQFGAKKAFVKVTDNNRIIAIIPDVENHARVRHLLQAEGRLGFWETYEMYELLPGLMELNRSLPALPLDESIEDVRIAEYKQNNPLFGLLNPFITADGEAMRGPAVGMVHYTDTAKVNAMLTSDLAKAVLPRDVRFIWTAKPTEETGHYFTLVAIKATRNGQAPICGDVITKAKVEHNKWSPEPVVDITMNNEGVRCWQRMTKDNIGKSIGMVVDGTVYSYPVVQCEITGGKSQITGYFTEEEAADLANMLNSGILPCPVRIIEEQIIEPNK